MSNNNEKPITRRAVLAGLTSVPVAASLAACDDGEHQRKQAEIEGLKFWNTSHVKLDRNIVVNSLPEAVKRLINDFDYFSKKAEYRGYSPQYVLMEYVEKVLIMDKQMESFFEQFSSRINQVMKDRRFSDTGAVWSYANRDEVWMKNLFARRDKYLETKQIERSIEILLKAFKIEVTTSVSAGDPVQYKRYGAFKDANIGNSLAIAVKNRSLKVKIRFEYQYSEKQQKYITYYGVKYEDY